MGILIAHRGWWWPNRASQNHPASILSALACGYGAEVDVQDVSTEGVMACHDEAAHPHPWTLPQDGPADPPGGSLFLHVKRAGAFTAATLAAMLKAKGWLRHAYVFCSPSNDGFLLDVKQADVGARTLLTISDRDELYGMVSRSGLPGGAEGLWIEQPGYDWVTPDDVAAVKTANLSAWVVSPELHGRELSLARVFDWREADGVVTDYPHLLARVLDPDDAVVHPKEAWW